MIRYRTTAMFGIASFPVPAAPVSPSTRPRSPRGRRGAARTAAPETPCTTRRTASRPPCHEPRPARPVEIRFVV